MKAATFNSKKDIKQQLIMNNQDNNLNKSYRSVNSRASVVSIKKSNFSQHGILKAGQGAGSSRMSEQNKIKSGVKSIPSIQSLTYE
mgnify:CR=1 FL=1